MFKWIKRILKMLIVILILGIVMFIFPTQPSSELIQKAKAHIETLQTGNYEYLILIDYNRPIFKKRLWVIDNETNEIVLNSHVSHAKKSGLIYATKFSNTPNSKLSSVGVFKTLGSYESNYGKGEYKIGMRVEGLEKTNNNVLARNIVFHPSYGLWSEGCFMTFPRINKEIIDFTKNGSFVFVNKG